MPNGKDRHFGRVDDEIHADLKCHLHSRNPLMSVPRLRTCGVHIARVDQQDPPATQVRNLMARQPHAAGSTRREAI